MRNLLILLGMLAGLVSTSSAQLSVGIGIAVPGISIGVEVPDYPRMLRVPGHPAYYAADLNLNLFFHDGFWWLYQHGNWYRSTWYDGPWTLIAPDAVPVFVLQVPLRYYRLPPLHFGGGLPDAPPRWAEHWGGAWASRRDGWERRDLWPMPPLAPLPSYQRRFGGERYPADEPQREMHERHYRYSPRERDEGASARPPAMPIPHGSGAAHPRPPGPSSPHSAPPRTPAPHGTPVAPGAPMAPPTGVPPRGSHSPLPSAGPREPRSGESRGHDRGTGDSRGGDRSR